MNTYDYDYELYCIESEQALFESRYILEYSMTASDAEVMHEGVKDVVENIFNAIKKFFAAIRDFLAGLIDKIKSFFGKSEKQADEELKNIEKDAKKAEAEGKDPVKDMDEPIEASVATSAGTDTSGASEAGPAPTVVCKKTARATLNIKYPFYGDSLVKAVEKVYNITENHTSKLITLIEKSTKFNILGNDVKNADSLKEAITYAVNKCGETINSSIKGDLSKYGFKTDGESPVRSISRLSYLYDTREMTGTFVNICGQIRSNFNEAKKNISELEQKVKETNKQCDMMEKSIGDMVNKYKNDKGYKKEVDAHYDQRMNASRYEAMVNLVANASKQMAVYTKECATVLSKGIQNNKKSLNTCIAILKRSKVTTSSHAA